MDFVSDGVLQLLSILQQTKEEVQVMAGLNLQRRSLISWWCCRDEDGSAVV